MGVSSPTRPELQHDVLEGLPFDRDRTESLLVEIVLELRRMNATLESINVPSWLRRR